ncbi:MAG TPA: lytic transglycosylase, partial [Flavobacteriaceae bacterium]|nr:lytic transglycosylase [Flavobacteriaceae bacterium]
MDSVWLAQLYNNDLFEEIYGSVVELDYEPVEYEELPTEVLKQRLKELDARTPFHVEYNPSLESVIKSYLKNRRRTMGRLIALSDYYFPMFEEEMARQGLPLEMKYLAVIESALDPKATSRVGAKGLWQFMFQTGKMFGLDVNSYVDERTDPLMATEAAAKYLKSLHNSLGDWDLALAAYNSGPGNVSKAIRRSGGKTNYWNIRQFLPRETAGYLPAFLATMYIFEYAEE